MDLNEAADMVAGSPPASSLEQTRADLAAAHADHPQRGALAQHAMDQIEAALHQLNSLGHYFHLSRGDAPQGEEFPRMLYRGGENIIVGSAEELEEEKKDGWQLEQLAAEQPPPEPEPPAEPPPPTFSPEPMPPAVPEPAQEPFTEEGAS